MKWTAAYRIFEVGENGPQTLYHGWHGSRTLPLDTPLRAKQGIVTNPGSSDQPTFRAGWHVTMSLKDAEKYYSHFRNERDLVICKVFVRSARPKPRSPHPVFLCQGYESSCQGLEESMQMRTTIFALALLVLAGCKPTQQDWDDCLDWSEGKGTVRKDLDHTYCVTNGGWTRLETIRRQKEWLKGSCE